MTETISFLSDEPYYTAEKLGLKNNTTREIDLTDDRFRKLVEMYQSGKYGKIIIANKNFIGSDEFIRDIQHIAFWKNLVIITWRHDGAKID